MFHKRRLSPTRVLLEFGSQKEMTLSLFRFSEFFEGLKGIRGKRFSFDEFVDKYSDRKGNLTYFSYWEGFNIPMKSLDEFCRMNELSKRELKVIRACRGLPDDGYLIACKKGDKLTLKHEMAHGRFFEDKAYRKEVERIVGSMPKRLFERMKRDLKMKSYCDKVIVDEIHAYLMAWNKDDREDIFPDIKTGEIKKYKLLLEKC